MSIKIVTDSTCDLPPALAAQYDITVLPAYINIGDESYLDGVDLSRQQFYEGLPNFTSHPTTAAPASGSFTETYERLAAGGASEIISIHVAAKLSGILNAARLGADAAGGVKVTLYDSQQLSMGLGLLTLSAAQAAAQGRSVPEICALLDEQVERAYVFAALDTLEFLRRSGRVNWAQFGIGTLLKIKPLVRVYKGEVEMLEKIRTSARVVARMIERVEELGPLERAALLHTHSPERAEALRQQAQHLLPAGDVPLAEVTPAIGAHVGPNGVGLAVIVSQ